MLLLTTLNTCAPLGSGFLVVHGLGSGPGFGLRMFLLGGS